MMHHPSILYVHQNRRYARRPTVAEPLPPDSRIGQDNESDAQNDNIDHFPANVNDFPANENRITFLYDVFGITRAVWDFLVVCWEIICGITIWLLVAILLPYILGTTFFLAGIVTCKILKAFLSEIDVHIVVSITSYLSVVCSSIYQKYGKVSNGETTMNRIWCLTLGYIVICILAFVINLFLNNGYFRRKYGQRIHVIVQANMLVLKVSFFMYIVPFIVCVFRDFLLDYFTLPLFKQATLDSRISYLKLNILSSLFIHFLIGFILKFLYFSTIVYIRKFVRPGLIWFIQTPNNAYFRPIENILQRHSLVHLSKLLESYPIDLFMVTVRIGVIVKSIEVFTPDLFPLRCPIK
jgi:E3 ubiquitin-protein ligase DOA10